MMETRAMPLTKETYPLAVKGNFFVWSRRGSGHRF
jgi:hypothetical protein